MQVFVLYKRRLTLIRNNKYLNKCNKDTNGLEPLTHVFVHYFFFFLFFKKQTI